MRCERRIYFEKKISRMTKHSSPFFSVLPLSHKKTTELKLAGNDIIDEPHFGFGGTI